MAKFIPFPSHFMSHSRDTRNPLLMTIHSLTFEDVAQVRNVRHLLEHAEVEEARLGVERPRPPDVDALHPVAAPAVEHVHVRVRVHQQTAVAERHSLQCTVYI